MVYLCGDFKVKRAWRTCHITLRTTTEEHFGWVRGLKQEGSLVVFAVKHLDPTVMTSADSAHDPTLDPVTVHRARGDPSRLGIRAASLEPGSGLYVGQVELLLPLVAAFGYDGQVQHEEDDPVASVQESP